MSIERAADLVRDAGNELLVILTAEEAPTRDEIVAIRRLLACAQELLGRVMTESDDG